MAAKISRQFNKVVLLGAPTSAAAMSAGHEAAPKALRAAGLADVVVGRDENAAHAPRATRTRSRTHTARNPSRHVMFLPSS